MTEPVNDKKVHYWMATISATIAVGEPDKERIINHTDNVTLTTEHKYINAAAINNTLFMFNRSLVETGKIADGAVRHMKFLAISYLGEMSDAEFTAQPIGHI